MDQAADLTDLLLDGARYGDLDDVQQALDQGVEIDTRDEQGRSALHMASANGHREAVKFLLEAGADPGASNQDGNTPLHYACLNGHLEVAEDLIQHGASPSTLNSHSRSPVDEAVGRPHQDQLLTMLARIEGDKACQSQKSDLFDPDDANAELVIPSKYGDPNWTPDASN